MADNGRRAGLELENLMTWTGWTLVNLTKDGSDDLVLNEFCDEGTATSSAWDLTDCVWRHVQMTDFSVSANPAATGTMSHKLEISTSEDAASYSAYKIFADGEYYCRAIKFRITVVGDPAAGQRPKITRGEVTAAAIDSVSWQGSCESTETSPPASPDPGERHLVAAAGTGGDYVGHENQIATCVAAEDDTWRYSVFPDGACMYLEDDDLLVIQDPTGGPSSCDARKTAPPHITLLPAAYDHVDAGSWNITADTAQVLNGYIENATGGAPANADQLTWKTGLRVATYTLVLWGMDDADCGILKVYFDSTLVATFDAYQAAPARNQRNAQTSIAVTAAKVVEVAVKVDGKNGSSTGYKAYISHISIWPE